MLGIESLFEPVDLERLRSRSEGALSRGVKLKKLGLAVAVYDEKGSMLVLEHKEEKGEYSHGDLGPSMETFRYIKGKVDTIESPYQTWLRSLVEELEIDQHEFTEAGLFIARQHVINTKPWVYGEHNSGYEIQADAFNMSVNISNPSIFTNRSSPEVANTLFMDPLDILRSAETHLRPGFANWTDNMVNSPVISQSGTLDLEWVTLQEVSEKDVLYPYNGYGG